MRRLVLATLLLAACDGPAGSDAGVERTDAGAPDTGLVDAGPPVRPPLAVYSEFLAYADVEPTLPALADRGAALSIGVPSTAIGDAALASLLRAAATASVEVRLWFLLPREDGYWPNEDNLATFGAEVTRLLDWLEADGLVASTLVYDLEPGLAYSEELRAGFSEGSLEGLRALMETHVDAARFAASRDALSAQVRAVQARGYRVAAVTYPQVVDDLGDGDADLQDALDIPVDGVPFDEVAFMTYQTAFAEAQGAWVGPGLIRSYATDAVAHFGDRATLALGIVGTAGIIESDGPPYASPEVLAQDVAAALGGGITRLEVYSLDGMVELADVPGWLAATEAVPSAPAIEAQARVVRGAARGLDQTLDAP